MVIVSPLIRKGTVDHTVYDHSSILATLERKLGMKALTERDKAANDLWHLLSGNDLRPDADCPRILDAPTKIPNKDDLVTEPGTDMDDLPLPKSGNIIGFLQILLKAELELAKTLGWGTATEIIKDFKAIVTHRHAREYVAKIKALLEKAEA